MRYRMVKCVKLRTDMESSMRTSPTYWLSRMQEGGAVEAERRTSPMDETGHASSVSPRLVAQFRPTKAV